MDLVRKIAGRHAKSLPMWVEMDEIVAAGYLGLCQAASRFDAKKHASFAAWASWRIHGAIMDNFEGPRYPRRYVAMPDEWLGEEKESKQRRAWSGRHLENAKESQTLPDALIDRTSVLETLIEREQCVVVSIDAVRARKTLTREEGAVLDAHVKDRSLAKIARLRKISRSLAHTYLVRAKKKMRDELERGDKAA
jgi:RNA polymerase sigma factor (sigma-70 family)